MNPILSAMQMTIGSLQILSPSYNNMWVNVLLVLIAAASSRLHELWSISQFTCLNRQVYVCKWGITHRTHSIAIVCTWGSECTRKFHMQGVTGASIWNLALGKQLYLCFCNYHYAVVCSFGFYLHLLK